MRIHLPIERWIWDADSGRPTPRPRGSLVTRIGLELGPGVGCGWADQTEAKRHSNSWGRAQQEQRWRGVHLGCAQPLLVTSFGAWFLSNLCLSFFICTVGMVTVSKLVRLLVSFHEMMPVKCLKRCLAYSKHSINTESTDMGELHRPNYTVLFLRNIRVSCWGRVN